MNYKQLGSVELTFVFHLNCFRGGVSYLAGIGHFYHCALLRPALRSCAAVMQRTGALQALGMIRSVCPPQAP